MKLNIDTCDRICGNRYFPLTFVAIAALYVLFYSITTSPLYGFPICDSGVFKMMGHVLLSGGVPYVDYFDHKGPYLYLINALGESISPVWGVSPIQAIWLSVAFILWFKIARLFVRPTYSLIVTIMTIVCLLGVYEYGDLTEEWSLLPSSVCLYVALSYLVKHTSECHSYWRSLVYGLCFGLAFFIRPNDAVMVCGGVMTGIFLYIIFIQKRYADAFLNGLVFVLGFGIMAAPWLIYFACHHALEDFWFGLIGFNINYSRGVLHNLCNTHIIIWLVVVCLILIVLEMAAKKKELLWISIPISVYILLFFGRNDFPHYYMAIVPAVFLLFLTMVFCQNSKILLVLSLSSFLFPGYLKVGVYNIANTSKLLVTGTVANRFDKIEEEIKEVQEYMPLVPESERDSIWNYSDIFSGMLYQCGIIAQNPVPPVIAGQQPCLSEKKRRSCDVISAKPKWILKTSDSSYFFPEDSVFIADNYTVVAESKLSTYQLLKRKR